MKVSEIIEELYENMEYRKKDSGETFVCLSEKAEQYEVLDNIIMEMHHDILGMLPDDHVYLEIKNIVDSFYDEIDVVWEKEDNEQEVAEFLFDILDELEPEIYTVRLLNWLSSNLNFVEYADEALNEGCDNMFDVLTRAYSSFQLDVANALVSRIIANSDLAEKDLRG